MWRQLHPGKVVCHREEEPGVHRVKHPLGLHVVPAQGEGRESRGATRDPTASAGAWRQTSAPRNPNRRRKTRALGAYLPMTGVCCPGRSTIWWVMPESVTSYVAPMHRDLSQDTFPPKLLQAQGEPMRVLRHEVPTLEPTGPQAHAPRTHLSPPHPRNPPSNRPTPPVLAQGRPSALSW